MPVTLCLGVRKLTEADMAGFMSEDEYQRHLDGMGRCPCVLVPMEDMMPTNAELLALCEKATPGPWAACQDGKCKCRGVGWDNGPVAKVECGEWGDEYPALRVADPHKGLSGTEIVVEAYMERIPYGSIPEEAAVANAQLIAAARTELPRLVRENEALSKVLYDLGWKCQWWKTGLLLVRLDIPIEPEEAP